MFHSFLLIDTGSDPNHPRPGRRWIGDSYRVHQRLCMAFPRKETKESDPHFLAPFSPARFSTALETLPQTHVHTRRDETAGFLFRVDPMPARIPSRHAIVIQSAIEPDWDYAFHNAPEFLCAKPLVRVFDPTLVIGQRLRFRLRANPTKKEGSSTKSERLAGVKKNGRRIALLHENDQIAWLLDKGEHGGFTIPGQWRETNGIKVADFRINVVPEGWIRCGKDGHRDGDFLAVRFDGILTIADAALFRRTLQHGIGSAKGFGFGLISIAPAEAVP